MDKESAVRISLIDVIYGVVLAYGFSFFDNANKTIDYILFFFAYSVVIIDWIYVHRLYWGWEYKYNTFFLLDICVLFSISRLLYTSTSNYIDYWLWMSILFFLYTIWDIFAKLKKMPSKYDWRFSTVADLLAAIIFLCFYIIFLTNIQKPVMQHHIFMIIVYVIAVFMWFKKSPKHIEKEK